MEHINKSSIKIMLAGHGNQAISTKLVNLKASPLHLTAQLLVSLHETGKSLGCTI